MANLNNTLTEASTEYGRLIEQLNQAYGNETEEEAEEERKWLEAALHSFRELLMREEQLEDTDELE